MAATRVLLVCGVVPPARCGVGDYTWLLATHLTARPDTEVAILAMQPADAPHDTPVRILPLAGWGLGEARTAVRLLRDWQPDVVHIQFPAQGYGRSLLPELLPVLARRSLSCPVVQTWHEYWHPLRLNRALRIFACDAVVFVRTNFADWMPTWVRMLLADRPVHFIPSASTIPKSGRTRVELAELRRQMGGGKRVIAYFGFALPSKGIEDIFRIADPECDHVLLICDLDPSDDYQYRILERIRSPRWCEATTVTGYQSPERVADLLAAADAVVLPFRSGGGEWNTSIHAAEVQGTYVVTTSHHASGYDPVRRICFAPPGDIAALRNALAHANDGPMTPGGIARPAPPDWNAIAARHLRLYLDVLKNARKPRRRYAE